MDYLFGGVPEFLELSSAPARLIFVGRLNPQKNLQYLPPILAELRELEWEFDIVGDGAERRTLETAFAECDLSGKVHFHGWLDRSAVEHKLKEAEIFILPSLVEGLSVAALEAMKFGLLLVGSDIPTLHECVTSDVNGYLLPLQSSRQWVDKLKTLLSDPALRLGMRQKSWKMVERFDLEAITDQYEMLFRKIALAAGDRHSTKAK